jgi:hypothetical protein
VGARDIDGRRLSVFVDGISYVAPRQLRGIHSVAPWRQFSPVSPGAVAGPSSVSSTGGSLRSFAREFSAWSSGFGFAVGDDSVVIG